MKRRSALKLLGKVTLLSVSLPVASRKLFGRTDIHFQDESGPRLVLIYDSRDRKLALERQLVEMASSRLSKVRSFWRQDLQMWDLRNDQREIAAFIRKYGTSTEVLNGPILVSVPINYRAVGAVELWHSEWLKHVESKAIDGCYPVSPSSGWWSVGSEWNPAIQTVRDHMFLSPNHDSGNFEELWLDSLIYGEIMSLHSDHHNEMIGDGDVTWANVNVECPQR